MVLLVRKSTLRAISLLQRLKVNTASFSTPSPVSLTAQQAQQQAMPPPQFDNQVKEYSPKIQTLVDEISKLNLIEVADLNELLRKRLNIKDVPVAAMSFAPSAATKMEKKEEESEPDLPKAVKSSFKVKLVKFDDTKKVALIKEIKTLVENMNLVQAKKFVESAPQVIKNDVSKDDAEKLKAQLEKVGAVVEIE